MIPLGTIGVKEFVMALQKIFCPCCSQSFYGSDQVGAVISCSNCGRVLEIKDGTVKEHVPGTKAGATQTVVEQSSTSRPQQSPVTSRHTSPESAVSSDAPVQPPELDIPHSSTHSVFDVAALQTVIWKVIPASGSRFCFCCHSSHGRSANIEKEFNASANNQSITTFTNQCCANTATTIVSSGSNVASQADARFRQSYSLTTNRVWQCWRPCYAGNTVSCSGGR